jgi:hypothetical protein
MTNYARFKHHLARFNPSWQAMVGKFCKVMLEISQSGILASGWAG